ncbi:DUF1772 domain-containing protein [Paeniglutamicibacter kerguelensis]|uniref:Membrane protein n=1 Tax=Paeniglutamicibacter kerguelensis TaxID=254788 RepID=A0ABS4XBH8_9MICC|nr:anthrone oxygenase family protein [Paeniglutamicibacter kerguelensis]MBP2385827.1 putative membrane protein [Paeniglutamicibacter kerguelensis]
MSNTIITALTAASAVCAGVAGGVYFAFTVIVMPALRTLPAAESVTAMQRINDSAVRKPFMAVFFGGAAASAGVLVADLTTGGTASNRFAGAALALVSFGVTVARNVPLNNTIARVAPDSLESAAQWMAFDRSWSRSNLVRGSAAIAATILLVESLSRSA